MKVETAIEYIETLLKSTGQVNQIIIHRQPGVLGDVTIEVRRQYRDEFAQSKKHLNRQDRIVKHEGHCALVLKVYLMSLLLHPAISGLFSWVT